MIGFSMKFFEECMNLNNNTLEIWNSKIYDFAFKFIFNYYYWPDKVLSKYLYNIFFIFYYTFIFIIHLFTHTYFIFYYQLLKLSIKCQAYRQNTSWAHLQYLFPKRHKNQEQLKRTIDQYQHLKLKTPSVSIVQWFL